VRDIEELNKEILYVKNSGLLVRETFASTQPLLPLTGSYAGQSASSVVAALSSASAASLAPVGWRTADASQHPDFYGIYLAFQRYRRAIWDLKEYLHNVELFSDSQIPAARKVSQGVSAMLQKIVRLFAHEHASIWSGSSRLIADLEGEMKPQAKPSNAIEASAVNEDAEVESRAEESMAKSTTSADENEVKGDVDARDETVDPDMMLSLPELAGVVKVGIVRYCLNPELLLASTAATGVAVLDAPSVVLKDVLAVLFIDGMLYLYDPQSAALPPLYRSDGSAFPDAELAVNVKDYVNDMPIKCLNVGAIGTFRAAVPDGVAHSPGKFDIQPLMCSHPTQEAFNVTCPTLTFTGQMPPLPPIQGAPQGHDPTNRYVPMANVFASPTGAAENTLQRWMGAIIDRFEAMPSLSEHGDAGVEEDSSNAAAIDEQSNGIVLDVSLLLDTCIENQESFTVGTSEGESKPVSTEPTLTL
jgi:hypothetical protein